MDYQPVTLYDYIFCGGGASAGLLLVAMHQEGLLQNKRVLILEKEPKTRRDKTFCFWSGQGDSIETSLHELISHSWENVILPGNKVTTLAPFRYNHISSLDLYQTIDVLARAYGWTRFNATVSTIEKGNDAYSVTADNHSFSGVLVFDSRNPHYSISSNGQTHLYQSFIGWHIRLNEEAQFSESFRFMDFDVDQSQYTQFVYTLPYSDGSMLVEVTRFGKEVIAHAEAEKWLDDYILKKFGTYRKIDEEQGCIPMSNVPLDVAHEEGIVQLGARNYSIKSSTGYAFKNMYNHAQRIVDSIKKSESPAIHNQSHSKANSGRFAFYDSLLLDILDKEPHKGKRIFESLFKNTTVPIVMKFLDEKTTLREEISIFAGLPIAAFLKSLVRKALRSSALRPSILTLICLALLPLPWHNELWQRISTLLLIVGFVLIGIPHGAVDHLLETKRWDYRRMPAFILSYLSVGILMAFIWYISPNTGLLLFLIYSAWHFGQADGALWQLKSATSLLWGASILTLILGSHFEETNEILQSMGTIPLPLEIHGWLLTPWTIWFLSTGRIAGAITTCWIMLSSQMPLPIAFGIYFIGQHSLTGWKHVKDHLQMSHSSIWLHSLPFHAGAWILLALFYLASPTSSENSSANWGVFFIFLACLSLPHVLAMQKVYKRT